MSKKCTLSWEEMYEYAKKFYEFYGHLEVASDFVTNDGYTYDEDGKIKLGVWIRNQRSRILPDSEKGKMLLQIKMRFNKKRSGLLYDNMHCCALVYYEHYGNLNVPLEFRTVNGYTHYEKGPLNLGEWINNQKKKIKIFYLIEENIPIYDKDGNLHEIFSMSDSEVLEKYNINLEEMILKNEEYIHDDEIKLNLLKK